MTTPRWLNDEEQALWRLMLAASRKMDRCLDETLQAGNDLSTSEFSVLVSLSEAKAPGLRLRDLCTVLDWDRSRTSHQITRMEKRGLVSKESCEGDARGVIVVLTEEGARRLERAAPDHVESVRRLIFDHLTQEQADVIGSFLETLMAVQSVPGAAGFEAEEPA
ncbi:DNA-binding transcriptional repressor MarR [Corynebacterium occultum]|uniref:DNA-binding transcriptional repressor MarR n=1 Tax=Corynebacterium occultum TaxID=2675219 RepID=A0A6B8WKV6_9CORY|nr:MarR family transcriptional regulator [Corynebacterium occultum]QGU07058.1 DNA-binding transcriptional repressor MarR [Corynebacterium occultum]